jgi:uncharacterized protein (TIGR00730 family)
MTEEEKKLAIETITLNRKDMHNAATERVAEIAREFSEGFKFLENYPKTVTFFGSTQLSEGDFYYEKARALSGRIVKELGFSVVSGGGPGIMEAADRGAFEAGGDSIGLLIKLPHAQPTNSYIKKSLSFYYFFARKVCLAFGAEVFIFFPGGLGTLDEFFEIYTLIQTKKIAGTPIICYGSEYWNKLKDFMEKEILPHHMMDKVDLDLFKITDSEDEIIEIIKKVKIIESVPFNAKDVATATVSA